MACKDCEKVAKKYVKVCQACREKEEGDKEEIDSKKEINNYAAEFCC